VVRCRASGTNVSGFLWYGRNPILLVDRLMVEPLTFLQDRRGRSSRSTSPAWPASSYCALELADCQLEHRRHLNDLLPSPAYASANAGGARPRDG
jgi:hypothetical protein